MDVEFENIENANIRDEVFEDEMEIDFENIMDQELSDEEILSDDSGCASNMNKYEIDHIEKFVSQRCDKYIEQLEELCRAKRPRLAVGHRQSTMARIVRFACKVAIRVTFVHISGEYASGEYASGNERSLVWREIDAAFESILIGAVINSNHIEPRQFRRRWKCALKRMRDAVERHGSVKVNTMFNGEFATKDKRANKNIITKNSKIYLCTDMCV